MSQPTVRPDFPADKATEEADKWPRLCWVCSYERMKTYYAPSLAEALAHRLLEHPWLNDFLNAQRFDRVDRVDRVVEFKEIHYRVPNPRSSGWPRAEDAGVTNAVGAEFWLYRFEAATMPDPWGIEIDVQKLVGAVYVRVAGTDEYDNGYEKLQTEVATDGDRIFQRAQEIDFWSGSDWFERTTDGERIPHSFGWRRAERLPSRGRYVDVEGKPFTCQQLINDESERPHPTIPPSETGVANPAT